MRIPLDEEHNIVKEKLKVPATYMIPVFIGIGYANPKKHKLEQSYPDMKSKYTLVNGNNIVLEQQMQFIKRIINLICFS